MSLVEANRSPCAGTESLQGWEKRQKELWLQLRTCEGVPLDDRERRAVEQADKFDAMQQNGWVRLERQRLILTRKGRMLADTIGLEIAALIESYVAEN
ncbi:hypothetical protein C2W62_40485 [Candidatus Entotheonella serta]|nr:hypothetical protein C2W62_40485 [Candidatus Entotheonella serta]